MIDNIVVKEVPIEEVVKVNATIVEFDAAYPKEYFEDRYKDTEKLIILAYIDNNPAGFIVSYDRFHDGSFYCWMAGVNPDFRKKGILKELMNYQDNWAKEKGYKKINIKTRNSRREMLSYLIKYWFFLTEVVQESDINENKILLEKNI